MHDNTLFIDECCWQPDSGWTGKLVVSHIEMKATLTGFEERQGFRGFQNDNVELTLASGETVTLLDCRNGLLGSIATATKFLAHAELLPNYLLVGDRRWTDSDLVARIEFCLPDARASLSFGDHRKMDIEGDDNETILVSKTHLSRTEIGRIQMPDMEITLSVQKTLARGTKDNVGDDPVWISVRFHAPSPLYETFQVPFHIATFFELSVGRPLQPRGFVVRAHRDPPPQEHYTHVDDFEFYRTENPVERLGQQHHEPVFTVWHSEERQVTLQALKLWLDRRYAWEVTYWLASQFVHGGREINRSNLLRAMAWFEAIPTYQLVSAMNDGDLRAFSRECGKLDSFKTLNVASSRLKEVLNELRRSTLSQRIEAAIADVNRYVGTVFLDNAFLEDCKRAKKLRDKAAHGGDASLEADFGEVVAATSAIETLAFISTICMLGCSPRKIRLVSNWAGPHPYAGYFSMKKSEARSW